jgi:hypothetical protein
LSTIIGEGIETMAVMVARALGALNEAVIAGELIVDDAAARDLEGPHAAA